MIASSVAVATFGIALSAVPAGASTSTSDATQSVERTALRVYGALESSADPASSYSALPDADRRAFEAYFLPSHTQETVVLTPLDPGARAGHGTETVTREYPSDEAGLASTRGCWGPCVKNTAWAAVGNAIFDT
jgi:hypothetical protein